MFFRVLLNYIFGFVNIEVEGYFIERFINICNNKNIFLWNLKRKRDTIIRFNINIRDFKKLKAICKKTKCRVKIHEKKGLPFLFHRYRKRKIFVLLAIFITVLLCILSNFVWNIEIDGLDRIKKSEINKIINDSGLKVGQMKRKINSKEIINQLRLKRNDIAWAGIEINGTNVILKIVESTKKPNIIEDNEYCNIIASKPGIIYKISAQNGTPLVEEDEMVEKGSILIAGWMEGKYTGVRYVHANGEVKAKTWYSAKFKQPLKNIEKIGTGNCENKYSVKINNFNINLSKKLSKFKNYDTIDTSKKLKLFSNFYLPIEITKTTYKEYSNVEKNYSVEEAQKIAINEATKQVDQQILDKQTIINKTINKTENEKYVEVEVVYEVLENIGTKEKIVF